MGEGGQQVLDMGGRAGGMRGTSGRLPLPTKFVEQISFQEIEEREVAKKKCNLKIVIKTFKCNLKCNLKVSDQSDSKATIYDPMISNI